MKQTAVEWLLFELSKNGLLPDGIPSDIHNKAKQMEKKQMKKAYNHERPNLLCYEKGTAFKKYYSETYKIEEI
jgi:hypothetical protein